MVGELREAGAQLVAISPEKPEHTRRLVERHGLDFGILFDEGNRLASQFNLVYEFPAYLREAYEGMGLDLAELNGPAGWTLPMPARYVIDAEGHIRYARVDPDYTRRPEPAETLEFLHETVGVA